MTTPASLSDRRRRARRRTEWMVRKGAALTLFVMVLIFIGAIGHLVAGAFSLLLPETLATAPYVEWSEKSAKRGIAEILRGLEYLFLAPIPHLTFISVYAFGEDQMRRIVKATSDEAAEPHDVRERDSVGHVVMEMKGLFAGLMVAVLLTDFISKLIAADREFSVMQLTSYGVGIVLCGAYKLLVDRRH